MKWGFYRKNKKNTSPASVPDVETHPSQNGVILSDEDKSYQKGLIITDDIAVDPILDFNFYRDAIVNIVKNSFPKFTIGIFGDWGTGKTTLMNSIDKALQNDKDHKDLVTVQFETWRYEREEQFVLIPLLKTIAFSLPEEPKYENLKGKLKRGAITFLKKSPEIVSSIVSKHLGEEAGEVTKSAIDSFREQVNAKVELLAEVDRDTLYYDGFDDIKKEISELRRKNPAFRIVIFVDDLDRCSPTKTLEVLESIKVFLGMEGFIYIIGISHDIVSKLIDIKYENSGVKGEQYIKKMIQIPITLPKWDSADIIELVKDFVTKGIIQKDYNSIVKDNIEIIAKAIENNPREIKRFLNNFIVALEIYPPSKNVDAKQLLLIQAIQLRWSKFYDLLIKSDDKFRIELKKYVEMEDGKRLTNLDSNEVKENENYDLVVRRVLRNFKDDSELWNFLTYNFDTLNSIKNWNTYRRAIEVSVEPTTRPAGEISKEALMLLRSGKVDEFNRRRTNEFQQLDLERADLAGMNLKGADLSRTFLKGANLSNANLTRADMTGADLYGAGLIGANLHGAGLIGANLRLTNLRKADLTRADLTGAILTEANLSDANLIEANFSRADLTNTILTGADLRDAALTGANLSNADLTRADMREVELVKTDLTGADLTGADLSKSLIINLKNFGSLVVNDKTGFDDAIIDDSDFIDYIAKFIKNAPAKINRNKLKINLVAAGRSKEAVDYLLRESKLPK